MLLMVDTGQKQICSHGSTQKRTKFKLPQTHMVSFLLPQKASFLEAVTG